MAVDDNNDPTTIVSPHCHPAILLVMTLVDGDGEFIFKDQSGACERDAVLSKV